MSRVVLVLTLGLAGVAGADEVRYIEAGQPYENAVVTAPLPAAVLGGMMLDTAAKLRRSFGDRAAEEAAPAAAAASAPAVSWRSASRPPEPGERERVAVLYARRAFRVGAEASRLKVLRLRVRYQDGLVVKLNGVEVARRYLDPAAGDALAYSPRGHGDEWETIAIPLGPGMLRSGDNVLAFEVRPSTARRAPFLDFELAGGDGLRVSRGPLVQRVGATSATVVFETDLPTRAELRYGRSATQLVQRAASSARTAPATRHVVQLGGLPASSRVFYQVVLDGQPQPVRSFATAPGAGEPLRFAVLGDVRTGHDVHARIARALADESPDFIISTGDSVRSGYDEAEWQKFFALTADLLSAIPLYPVCGNHDLGESPAGQRTFEDIFALWPAPADRPRQGAWYGFDVGGVHFAILDSNRYDDPAQLAWLEEDLAAARKRGVRAIFAATHHGPWSRGPHGGSAEAQALFVPVLEKHGVTLIFAGHDHIYQRGRVGNLRYVLSGGGGAPLYPLRCAVGAKGCDESDGAEAALSENHYVLVEVFRDYGRLCARRPDGTPLEECVSFSLSDASWRREGSDSDRAARAPRSPSAGP